MKVPRRRLLTLEERPRLMMTPMIDVVFQLILFFMLTPLTGAPGQLEARLPATPGLFPQREVEPEEFTRLVLIELRQRNTFTEVRIEGELALDLEALYRRLLFIRSEVLRPVILIDAEDDVPVGLVVGVFDTCRRARFADINFTPPTDEEPTP